MEEPVCPICGSRNVEKMTEDVSTPSTILLNYRCNDCDEYFEWL